MSEQSQQTETGAAGTGPESGTIGKTCANCGASIDEYDWHPIRGREDDDGEFDLFSFCSEECVAAWEQP